MNILQMGLNELLNLRVEDITRLFTAEEFRHIAKILGALWEYDYKAAAHGKPGMHARLKSERHSDVFFVSKIMLEHENIRKIMANQMVMKLKGVIGDVLPSYIAGIPDGATKLGEDVAEILGVKFLKMKKVEGRIILVTPLNPGESILFIEDFCTQGTGFKETVSIVLEAQPEAVIFPFDPVMLNRGGLEYVRAKGAGTFMVVAVAKSKENDWAPDECVLCKTGSIPIKPKATDENWKAITTSQQ